MIKLLNEKFKSSRLLFVLLALIFTFVMLGGTIQKTNAATPKQLKLHFIDVGQADSILVQTPGGKNMLVDAGNNADGDTVVDYLKSQGVKKLDAIVGTHPHEDHIGGMDTVINSFDIGSVYMPKATSNTATFRDVMEAIQTKGLKINTATGGKSIALDPAIKIDILAPNSDKYEDLNNYSAVLKITYGKNSFLLTGDAEDVSEREMLAKKYNLKADLLKVGHHGSKSSTTAVFLNAVKPAYAVISVGKGNDYGHPAQLTIDKLTAIKAQVFRTDEMGTIVATSDGTTIKIDKKASAVKTNAPPANNSGSKSGSNISPKASDNKNATVYITKTGKKYHRDGCRSLSKSKIPIKLSDAISRGYGPCSICNPPQR